MTLLYADSPQALRTIVLLNGKPLRHYISAKEGSPGWVEVIDSVALIAQPDNEDQSMPEPFEQIPTKRVEGIVEFKSG